MVEENSEIVIFNSMIITVIEEVQIHVNSL